MDYNRDPLRVFVSSTVYDLVDVRAELNVHLAAMGATPVLSDDKTSGFRVRPDVNSIETCLVNLDSCDEVIVILDRRYGPRLGDCGFDDVSATHLEYRRAMSSKRPVHVFVRDRLEAEFSIWKRNKRPKEMRLSWVAERDFGLFELLDEHAELSANREGSNWYATFSSSIDLKAAISSQFQESLLPRRLIEALASNQFPLLDIHLDVTDNIKPTPADGMAYGERLLKYSTTITNVTGSAAFNTSVY